LDGQPPPCLGDNHHNNNNNTDGVNANANAANDDVAAAMVTTTSACSSSSSPHEALAMVVAEEADIAKGFFADLTDFLLPGMRNHSNGSDNISSISNSNNGSKKKKTFSPAPSSSSSSSFFGNDIESGVFVPPPTPSPMVLACTETSHNLVAKTQQASQVVLKNALACSGHSACNSSTLQAHGHAAAALVACSSSRDRACGGALKTHDLAASCQSCVVPSGDDVDDDDNQNVVEKNTTNAKTIRQVKRPLVHVDWTKSNHNNNNSSNSNDSGMHDGDKLFDDLSEDTDSTAVDSEASPTVGMTTTTRTAVDTLSYVDDFSDSYASNVEVAITRSSNNNNNNDASSSPRRSPSFSKRMWRGVSRNHININNNDNNDNNNDNNDNRFVRSESVRSQASKAAPGTVSKLVQFWGQ
jgi:hypothetical protein